MNSSKNKRLLISLSLIICSIFIKTYQSNYSVSAKTIANLKDFDKVNTLFSIKVSHSDIKKITKEDNKYSFTNIDNKNVDNVKELGKVFMFDKNGDLINNFLLFKQKEKYLILMRGIYMSID